MKRVLSLLMAVVLLVGNVPVAAFAAEEIAEEMVAEMVAETAAPTEAATEPAKVTAAATEAAAETSVPTVAPTEAATEPVRETIAPTEPAREETIAPTLPPVPEETSAPTEAVPEETAAPTAATTEPVEESVPEETVAEELPAEGVGTVASGTCGKNLTWNLDENGTLTISGTGAMDESSDKVYGSAPWEDHKDSIVCAVIEDGVTGLDIHAFSNCRNLEKVTIAASVTTIGWYDSQGGAGGYNASFYGCDKLKSIGPIGSGCDFEFGWTESIPAGAFFGMGGVTKIIMPATITSIGTEAFRGMSMVTSAGPIGSGCDYEFGWTTKIADGAFNRMYYLNSVTIPETVTSIGDNAFYNCSALLQISIPTGVTSIGGYAFSGCTKLQEIVLPENLKVIGEWAFASCSAVTEMVLPNGLDSLGRAAFYGCKFKNIVIPEKITAIEDNTFYGCSALESITLPSTLVSVGASAFSGCSSLKEITLPQTVTTLAWDAFKNCSGLTTITIPDLVTSIESWTFAGCSTLVNIVIPAGVTSIGEYAFYNCPMLTDVYFKGSYGDWGKVTIGNKNDVLSTVTVHCAKPTGGSCSEAATWTLTQEGVLTISGQGAVTETPWKEYVSQITVKEIVVEDGITALPSQAFSHLWYCEEIEKVTIAGSVAIAPELFDYDVPIQKAGPIGSGCEFEYGWTTEIPDRTFKGMKNLLTFQFPEAGPEGGMKRIGNLAFFGCESLAEITLPNTLEELGNQVFYKCTSLKEMTIPASVREMGFYTFEECTALEDLVILAPVEWLGYALYDGTQTRYHGYGMLSGCTGLRTITLPRSVSRVYENLFYSCTALKDVYYGGSQEEWDALMTVLEPGNENLRYATVHPGIETRYLKNVCFFDAWHSDCAYLINSEGGAEYRTSAEVTDSEFLANPEKLLGTYVIPQFVEVDGEQILQNLLPVESHSGTVQEADLYDITINGVQFQTPADLSAPILYVGRFVIYHLYEGNLVGLDVLRFEDYLDNNEIEVNGQGKAYAFYRGAPSQKIICCVNGREEVVCSDAEGVYKIPLGEFKVVFTHEVPVEIIQVGNVELDPALVLTPTVKVVPFSYAQKTTLSFAPEISASLIEGAKLDLMGWKAEASLGGVEGKIAAGNAVSFNRAYKEDSTQSFEISSTMEAGVGAEIGAGVYFGKDGKQASGKKSPQFTLAGLSAGADGMAVNTYGIRFDDYTGSAEQNLVIGTFIWGELLKLNPKQIFMYGLYRKAAEELYPDCGAVYLEGSGVKVAGSVGGGMGALKINGEDIFSVIDMDINGSFGLSEQSDSDGKWENSFTLKTDSKVSVGNFKVGGDNQTKFGLLSQRFLGTEFEIKTESPAAAQQKSITATSLDSSQSAKNFLIFGEYVELDYDTYKFEGASLDALTNRSAKLKSFANGGTRPLTDNDLMHIASALSDSETPIAYTQETKQSAVFSVPLELGGGAGVAVDISLTAAVENEVSYDSAKGLAVNDELLLTSETNDVSQSIKNDMMAVPEYVQAVLTDVLVFAQEFVEWVGGDVTDGVEADGARISGKENSQKDWRVEVSYVGTDANDPAVSYRISTFGARETASMDTGISSLQYGNALTTGATLAQPYVVSVTDNATGEAVTDLREEPLELTICYTQEHLEAAGISADSNWTRNGDIAMYRFCDDGDYFEYVGGINDPEAMTVTCSILRTGQYVLAVDTCAPALSYLDISDFGQTPEITAHVDDLTGLDVSSFVFALDGGVKVSGGNIGEHYDQKTGIFTYCVPEEAPLSEGVHTLSFTLADTSGNSETYDYSFQVDLTAPVISDVSVVGAPNEEDCIEIRAQVSDLNLSAVYAVFSKLLPDGTWSEEVSALMGDMGNGLWGLDYVGEGSTVRIHVKAVDLAENTAESDAVQVHPFVETLTISHEYLALSKGRSAQLSVQVNPLEFANAVQWSVDDDSVISVDESSGIVTAENVGTAYVLASVTDGDTTLTARCRVDVTESVKPDGVQLSTTKVTTELFSTNYAGFEILLQLPQNYPAASTYKLRSVRPGGVAIEKAYFTNEAVRNLFDILVLDDRSMLVIPNYENAVLNPGKVKSEYKSTVTVEVQGQEYVTGTMTLTVKKTKPSLTASVKAFNSFYSDQSRQITIKGGTAMDISLNTSKAAPQWLKLAEDGSGVLTLKENAPRKSTSAKVYLRVWTEEWSIPASVTLTVKNSFKTRGLKLSASSVTASKLADYSEGVTLKLLPTAKNTTLEDLCVKEIIAPAGYTVSDFDRSNGSFVLKADNGFRKGTVTLKVSFSDTTVPQPLKLTVKTASVTLKPSVSKVTLNKTLGDSAVISITASPKDYRISGQSIRLTNDKGKDKLTSGELDIQNVDGQITVSTTELTPAKAVYKLYVSAAGTKTSTITINVVSGKPSVTFKSSGSMDLSFPEKYAALKPSFKNCIGDFVDFEYTVAEMKGKKVSKADVKDAFLMERDGKNFRIRCVDESLINIKNTFKVKLRIYLDDGTYAESSVTLKVKRTEVKLKLGTTKMTLNRKTGDKGSIALTCTTKGYAFEKPVWQIKDAGGNVVNDALTIDYKDGNLIVATNEETLYGTTYMVILRANEKAPAYTVTVTIPSEANSTITASVKIGGKIDVIRDGSAVTVTPVYKNRSTVKPTEETIYIYSSADNYTNPVNDLFTIEPNGKGGYTIARKENAELNHTYKYKVQVVSLFGEMEVASPKTSVTVTMGSAKVKTCKEGTTLFAKDQNDRALVWFESSDASLNEVTNIRIKDTKKVKYSQMFEVIPYGDGLFAIGFKDGSVHKSLIGKTFSKTVTLTLNLTLDGNQTSKTNATATVKLTIVK